MADNTAQYATVIGEAFNIKRHNDDKTNFAVKSFVTGNITNCTLWDSSHAHVKLENGDCVIVNGKIKKTPKSDGDGFWINLSASRIGIIPMDSGERVDAPVGAGVSDDAPDVM